VRAADRSSVLAAAVRVDPLAVPRPDVGRFNGVAAAACVADGCLDFDGAGFASGFAACSFERSEPVPPEARVDALAAVAVADLAWPVVRSVPPTDRPPRACGPETFDGVLAATFAGAFAEALAADPRVAA